MLVVPSPVPPVSWATGACTHGVTCGLSVVTKATSRSSAVVVDRCAHVEAALSIEVGERPRRPTTGRTLLVIRWSAGARSARMSPVCNVGGWWLVTGDGGRRRSARSGCPARCRPGANGRRRRRSRRWGRGRYLPLRAMSSDPAGRTGRRPPGTQQRGGQGMRGAGAHDRCALGVDVAHGEPVDEEVESGARTDLQQGQASVIPGPSLVRRDGGERREQRGRTADLVRLDGPHHPGSTASVWSWSNDRNWGHGSASESPR